MPAFGYSGAMHGVCQLRMAPLILALAWLSGCGVSPRVLIEDSAWVEKSDEAALLRIELEVVNRGVEAIELREMEYTVRFPGASAYRGRRATALTIAPGAAARVMLPAIVVHGNVDSASLPEEFSLTGTVQYVAPGRLAMVLADLGLPRPRAAFTGSGEPVAVPR
jgi:hypothetical protein